MSVPNVYTQCLYTQCLYTQCLYTQCLYTQCLYTQCLYTQCLYTQCLYTKCLYTQCLSPNVRAAKIIFNIADLLLSYYYVKLVLHEHCCMPFQIWNVHLLGAIIVTLYYCVLPLNVIHALYVMRTQECQPLLWQIYCADNK